MLRLAFVVSTFTFISRIFGYVRDIFIASILGTGPLAEAYIVAFRLPNLFRSLFAEGAFNAAFVPRFTKMQRAHQADGTPENTQRFVSHTFSLLALLLLCFVGITELCMPWVVYAMAPGFVETPEKFALAVTFARITMPYLLCISLVSMLSGILQSYQKFAVPAAAPILLNLSMIGGLLCLSPYTATPGHALVMGISIAGALQLALLLWACKRLGMLPQVVWPVLTPEIKALCRHIVPGMVGSASTQVNLFINTMMASLVPGAMAFLYFSDRVVQLPLSLIGTALGTVLLPLLSEKLHAGAHHEAQHLHNRSIEIALLLALPAAAALATVAEPVISMLFERGAFSHQEAQATAHTMIALACGLPAFVLLKLMTTPFFAHHDTKTPVKIAMVCIALNIGLNFLLIPSLRHIGIALSTSITAWVNLIALGVILQKRDWWHGDFLLRLRTLKITLATVSMAGSLWFLLDMLHAGLQHTALAFKLLHFIALLGGGACSYFAVLCLLSTIPYREVKQLFAR